MGAETEQKQGFSRRRVRPLSAVRHVRQHLLQQNGHPIGRGQPASSSRATLLMRENASVVPAMRRPMDRGYRSPCPRNPGRSSSPPPCNASARAPRSEHRPERPDARQRDGRPPSPHRRVPPRCRTAERGQQTDCRRRVRPPSQDPGGVCSQAGTRYRCEFPPLSRPSRTDRESANRPAKREPTEARHRSSTRKRRSCPRGKLLALAVCPCPHPPMIHLP